MCCLFVLKSKKIFINDPAGILVRSESGGKKNEELDSGITYVLSLKRVGAGTRIPPYI